MAGITRRDFLKYSTAATAATAATGVSVNVVGANDRIRIGLMGCGGRGTYLLRDFIKCEGVEITFLADPDSNRLNACGAALEKETGLARFSNMLFSISEAVTCPCKDMAYP